MIGRTVYHPVHGSVTVCLCLVLWICMCTFVYLHFNVSEYSVGRLGFQVWGHQWVTLCVFECIWALRSLKECQISVHMCLFNNSMCVSLRMSVFCICVGVWVNLRLLFVFLIVSLWVPGFCVHVCVFVCRSALLCVHVCVCVCVCVCISICMCLISVLLCVHACPVCICFCHRAITPYVVCACAPLAVPETWDCTSLSRRCVSECSVEAGAGSMPALVHAWVSIYLPVSAGIYAYQTKLMLIVPLLWKTPEAG
jgi:hypothetical protein